MNAIGIALVWCVVQVTLIGVLAAGLYVVVRRLRPAAAGPVVLASLTAVVVLSLLALSPWPRWFTSSPPPPGERPRLATVDTPATTSFIPSSEQGLDATPTDASASTSLPPSAEQGPLVTASEAPPKTSPLPLAGEGSGVRAVDTPEMPIEMPAVPPAQDAPAAKASTPPTPPPAPEPPDAPSLWQKLADDLLGASTAAAAASDQRWPAVVAVLLPAGMAAGLAWLVLGVFAVRCKRRRSRPVGDRQLLELVDTLRAELSCRRPVEIRQSDDLIAAATIGWRRPVLLLPADWASWTADERRAVLAHEVAHARSHDFLALLFGQLGLVLHFYHPLVHWLMGRLRLEQELAADAAAASVSGGQRQYLATIATLALRQSERPLSWPARTFLPTRTTFLRRIAMLRDSKLRTDRLSPAARLATIGGVLLCGLLVAGLRGPARQSEALADDAARPPAASGRAELIKTFNPTHPLIAKDGVTVEQNAWRIVAKRTHTVRLFEVSDPGVDDCTLIYRAKLKAEDIQGRAYLEMWCRMPGGGEYFSRGLMNPVTGTVGWSSYETPFYLKKGEQPDLVKLNVVIEGKGALWIKDVELLKGPLPPAMAGTSPPTAAAEPAEKRAIHSATTESVGDLLNGGFEQGDQLPDGWTQGAAVPGVTYSWDKQTAFEGKASLSIEKTANRYFPIAQWYETVDREGDLPALQVSAQVKAENVTKAILDVIFYDKNGKWISHQWADYIGAAAIDDPPANHDWREYSGSVEIPEGTAKICVALQDYGPGKVWFDNVRMAYLAGESQSGDAGVKAGSSGAPAGEAEASTQAGGRAVLSHVGDSSTDMRSFADSGFAEQFERPAEAKSIVGVQIFAARYGYPKPPDENFHIYLLDENKKVLEEVGVPYGKVERGDLRWYTFSLPAVQIPEKFFVALWFDAERTKGVYLGMDKNVKQAHSWIGLPDRGFEKVNEPYDWMIRAVVSDEPGKAPSRPKVTTYGEEKAADTETVAAQPTRTWTDSTGTFQLDAEYLGVEDGKAKLKKTDGKILAVPLERLSQQDRDFIAAQTSAKEKPAGKPQELAHDDGKMAGRSSIAGGGHAVKFQVDGDSWYVTSVSLHGSRYGEARPPREDFDIWICDDAFKPIATFHFPYASFTRSAPGWKSFRIKPTPVPPKFIVCFAFNPHQTKGVMVSYDGQPSKDSLIGVPDQLAPKPFTKGNWLIRCKVENRPR